ncbi:hypothetical protein HDV05_000351, partial [Chytridiales sp. JEL 0842]
KWRPAQLFNNNRKTCCLSHIRLGDPDNNTIVVSALDDPEISPEISSILRRCELLYYECFNLAVAVPEVIESLTKDRGTFDALQRYLHLRFRSTSALVTSYFLNRGLEGFTPSASPFILGWKEKGVVGLEEPAGMGSGDGVEAQIYLARLTFNEARPRKMRRGDQKRGVAGRTSKKSSILNDEDDDEDDGDDTRSEITNTISNSSFKSQNAKVAGSGISTDFGPNSGGYALALFQPLSKKLIILDLVLRSQGGKQGFLETQMISALVDRVEMDIQNGIFGVASSMREKRGKLGSGKTQGLVSVRVVIENAFEKMRAHYTKAGFSVVEHPLATTSTKPPMPTRSVQSPPTTVIPEENGTVTSKTTLPSPPTPPTTELGPTETYTNFLLKTRVDPILMNLKVKSLLRRNKQITK